MLWADGNDNSPWWALGVGSAIGVGYGLIRLYVFLRDQVAESKAKREALAAQGRKNLTEEQKAARRDAATEAVPVVERLILEVQGQTRKIEDQAKEIRDIQERERECSEERAADKVLLRILVGWARRQPNPPPIPEDVLAQFGGDGSGSHAPLSDGAGS